MPAQDHTVAPDAGVDTMRAVVRTEYGPADVVHLARVPRPAPGAGEVLVQVRAAGLDRGVWHVMTGLPYLSRLAFGVRRPKNAVLGSDLAGTVVAVGQRVTRFAVGDDVYGVGTGSFAEFAVASEKGLARMPSMLTYAQASIVPISAVTALKGLRDAGRIEAGQQVLISGASGGVGSYAVQLAKALGAEVTGTASSAKLDLVRSLGADHVLDYARQDFADDPHRYDLILDIAGNPSLDQLRRALTPTGTAVLTGGEDNGRLTGMSRQLRALALSPFIRQRLTMFLGTVRASDLEAITALLEAGTITPSLERSYPLEHAPQAFDHLIAGKVRGKVALTV